MKKKLTDILGSQYPIILGPMRFITLGKMAALVSKYGGFGQIAASGLTTKRLREEIRVARTLTDMPFGVNFPVYRPKTEELIQVAVEEGVKTITTSAGNPKKFIDRIKGAGLKVLHKVANIDMAKKAEDAGVDAIIATGIEAGGHVGRDGATTFCLIPQLARALSIPVVAAGGIADASTFRAVLALGASGAEIGTRFLVTNECPVPDYFKNMILDAKSDSTVLIGKGAMPMRVLNNQAAQRILEMDRRREDRDKINKKADDLYVRDREDGQDSILPCGQVAGLIDSVLSIEEVIRDIAQGME
ncbi:MAG TPA: nitronate monooxygenase [Desulfobacterales bacterium]|nr:nitronate monooxygenase [Desulfobacterales bacterium]